MSHIERLRRENAEKRAEVRAALDARSRREDGLSGATPSDDPPVFDPVELPTESRNQRHRRELAERDQEWKRECRRADREKRNIEARIMAAVDARIAAARAELRADMVEIAQAANAAVEAIGTAIGELRDVAKGPDVVRQVDRMFERLERKIDEALPRRAERGGEIVDLPNPLARRAH